MNLQQLFSRVIARRFRPKKFRSRARLEHLRQCLRATLEDCTDVRVDRLNYRIDLAQTPSDLWLLRSDLHQCIAQLHSQQVAVERINALIPSFRGSIPSLQLLPI
ncbi:MAG: hypothetical protein JWP47_2579 [Polaromonas sp.]|jgi:hypothetical protein|nr:hypothetical protein [Polaromonas sp.]